MGAVHGYRHQEVPAFQLQVASFLAHFVEACPLERGDESLGSDGRQLGKGVDLEI